MSAKRGADSPKFGSSFSRTSGIARELVPSFGFVGFGWEVPIVNLLFGHFGRGRCKMVNKNAQPAPHVSLPLLKGALARRCAFRQRRAF